MSLASISPEDLCSLIAHYNSRNANDVDYFDALCNLRTYQRWLQDPTGPKCTAFDVLVLDNEWDSDGLFLFAIEKGLLLYTTDDSSPRLALLPRLTNDLNLAMVSTEHLPVIKEALMEMHTWTEYIFYPHHHYYCPVDVALAVTYEVPDHLTLRPLTAEHAAEVDRHISYRSENTENYMRSMIAFMPCMGAFLKSTGELVGWILSYFNESHSALTVKPKYQRQGIARLLARKMMRDRALQGKASHCHIRDGNVPSERLFLSLGFKRTHPLLFGGRNGLSF